MTSRFWSTRDNNTIDLFNEELINNIIDTKVIIYKVDLVSTKENIYGESHGGNVVYSPGIEVPCLIEHEDITFETNEFGPDSNQSVTFRFHRNTLVDNDIRPDIGDIIWWNFAGFEINSFNENNLLGGDVTKNHDLIAITHLSRVSKHHIEQRIRK